MEGQILSHYRVLSRLGGGGMGLVYKAEDLRLKRPVALKFLPPGLTRDDDARGRFVQEAQAASALDHANICTIYEIDTSDDGQLFIAMAYIERSDAEETPHPGSAVRPRGRRHRAADRARAREGSSRRGSFIGTSSRPMSCCPTTAS